MSFANSIFVRTFGRPQGILGSLGGSIMARMNKRMAQQAIELLNILSSDRVLEIGFGPGVGIEILASIVSSGSVAGIDPSEVMLRQASARNATDIEAGKVELSRGSAESLPYDNSTFNAAMAINSMQLWPDTVAGLQEARRILMPGGRIALCFTPHSGQVKEDVEEALRSTGFADVRVVDVGDGFCVLAVRP